MNTYSDNNPPKSGNAKKIYTAFKEKGWDVADLHYNPNCWGKASENGWGTWACKVYGTGLYAGDSVSAMFFCGIQNNRVYIQRLNAPYTAWYVDDIG